MRKLRLLETCTQYSVARNRYGDFVLTQIGIIACLYRNISLLNRGVNFREELQIQGIFWFDPTATVKMGDIIGYGGQFFRIEDVIIGKELVSTNNIHFIKCHVSVYRSIS